MQSNDSSAWIYNRNSLTSGKHIHIPENLSTDSYKPKTVGNVSMNSYGTTDSYADVSVSNPVYVDTFWYLWRQDPWKWSGFMPFQVNELNLVDIWSLFQPPGLWQTSVSKLSSWCHSAWHSKLPISFTICNSCSSQLNFEILQNLPQNILTMIQHYHTVPLAVTPMTTLINPTFSSNVTFRGSKLPKFPVFTLPLNLQACLWWVISYLVS